MARTDVDAVVLVGGKGTRLRPLTLSAPKPMLPTAGVPFLEHQLSRIRAAGIEHVVLGTSYKAETFTEHFGDGSAFGLSIEYLVEDEPLGTGGAIRNVASALRGAPFAIARSRVPSVEPESTTTISSQKASESMQASMRSASLSVMMQAERAGRSAGVDTGTRSGRGCVA